MLTTFFARRAIYVGSRSLFEHAEVIRTSLRHLTARVEVRHQIEFASSTQFANCRLFCKYARSKPYQTLNPQDSSRTMSDDAYSSFLDQANQDTGASKASTKSKSAATKAADTDVPVTLQKVDQYYTSESDEPFEPVSLKWSGKNMPSESMQPATATLVGPKDVNAR